MQGPDVAQMENNVTCSKPLNDFPSMMACGLAIDSLLPHRGCRDCHLTDGAAALIHYHNLLLSLRYQVRPVVT